MFARAPRIAACLALALAGCGGEDPDPIRDATAADAGGASDVTPPADAAETPDASAPRDGGAPEDAAAADASADAGRPMGPPVVETVTRGLQNPWAIEFLPDGRALITERPGRLRVLDADGQLGPALAGVPSVYASGQGGLLDLHRSPSFAQDGLLYMCYAARDGRASGTEVARARLVGDRLEGLEVIFRVSPKTIPSSNHYGCRLAFDPEGHLYVGVGDRTQREAAQSLDNHLGKIMRLMPDGSIPPDNPYVGQSGALDEIWSYGHRNIQGMTVHPSTGEIWNSEHGPQGGDEINIARAGENHGWPLACYGSHYDGRDIPDDHAGRGFSEPIHYWTPSIAPAGTMFYQGDLFPEWRGQLFVGALAFRHLARLELDGERVVNETRLLDGEGWRIRDVTEGPDGAIYVVVDAADGRVVRITRR